MLVGFHIVFRNEINSLLYKSIFAETSTGCMMAGTALGRREIPAESVGIKAANELLQAIQSGACVDAYTQDQVCI